MKENQCIQCDEGYFINNKICIKMIEGCEQYNENGKCINCYKDLVYDNFKDQCLQLPLMTYCKQTMYDFGVFPYSSCQECYTGIQYNHYIEDQVIKTCQKYHSHCILFDEYNHICMKCDNQSQLTQQGKCMINKGIYKDCLEVNEEGCSQCNNGNPLQLNFEIGNKFICSMDLINHCQTYNSETGQCIKCDDLYIYNVDQRKCVNREFTFQKNCDIINDQQQCLSCKEQYHLEQGQCVNINIFNNQRLLVSFDCVNYQQMTIYSKGVNNEPTKTCISKSSSVGTYGEDFDNSFYYNNDNFVLTLRTGTVSYQLYNNVTILHNNNNMYIENCYKYTNDLVNCAICQKGSDSYIPYDLLTRTCKQTSFTQDGCLMYDLLGIECLQTKSSNYILKEIQVQFDTEDNYPTKIAIINDTNSQYSLVYNSDLEPIQSTDPSKYYYYLSTLSQIGQGSNQQIDNCSYIYYDGQSYSCEYCNYGAPYVNNTCQVNKNSEICSNYDNTTQACTKCKDDYYLSLPRGICKKADFAMLNCIQTDSSGNNCQKCKDGYKLEYIAFGNILVNSCFRKQIESDTSYSDPIIPYCLAYHPLYKYCMECQFLYQAVYNESQSTERTYCQSTEYNNGELWCSFKNYQKNYCLKCKNGFQIKFLPKHSLTSYHYCSLNFQTFDDFKYNFNTKYKKQIKACKSYSLYTGIICDRENSQCLVANPNNNIDRGQCAACDFYHVQYGEQSYCLPISEQLKYNANSDGSQDEVEGDCSSKACHSDLSTYTSQSDTMVFYYLYNDDFRLFNWLGGNSNSYCIKEEYYGKYNIMNSTTLSQYVKFIDKCDKAFSNCDENIYYNTDYCIQCEDNYLWNLNQNKCVEKTGIFEHCRKMNYNSTFCAYCDEQYQLVKVSYNNEYSTRCIDFPMCVEWDLWSQRCLRCGEGNALSFEGTYCVPWTSNTQYCHRLASGNEQCQICQVIANPVYTQEGVTCQVNLGNDNSNDLCLQYKGTECQEYSHLNNKPSNDNSYENSTQVKIFQWFCNEVYNNQYIDYKTLATDQKDCSTCYQHYNIYGVRRDSPEQRKLFDSNYSYSPFTITIKLIIDESNTPEYNSTVCWNPIPYCSSYILYLNGTYDCKTCEGGLSYSSEKHVCIDTFLLNPLMENCAKPSQDGCTKCITGYTMTYINYNGKTPFYVCGGTINNCAIYGEDGYCQQCNKNYRYQSNVNKCNLDNQFFQQCLELDESLKSCQQCESDDITKYTLSIYNDTSVSYSTCFSDYSKCVSLENDLPYYTCHQCTDDYTKITEDTSNVKGQDNYDALACYSSTEDYLHCQIFSKKLGNCLQCKEGYTLKTFNVVLKGSTSGVQKDRCFEPIDYCKQYNYDGTCLECFKGGSLYQGKCMPSKYQLINCKEAEIDSENSLENVFQCKTCRPNDNGSDRKMNKLTFIDLMNTDRTVYTKVCFTPVDSLCNKYGEWGACLSCSLQDSQGNDLIYNTEGVAGSSTNPICTISSKHHENCLQINSKGFCVKCSNDSLPHFTMFSDNTRMLSCITKTDNCMLYDHETLMCAHCNRGYTLWFDTTENIYQCRPYSQNPEYSRCVRYNNLISQCTQCLNGYVLKPITVEGITYIKCQTDKKCQTYTNYLSEGNWISYCSKCKTNYTLVQKSDQETSCIPAQNFLKYCTKAVQSTDTNKIECTLCQNNQTPIKCSFNKSTFVMCDCQILKNTLIAMHFMDEE